MHSCTKKLARLCFYCFCLWLFFAVIGPFIESKVPAWQYYNKVQEEQNLDSGALYYSNVPQTQEAEQHLRQAVREAMLERRKARQEKPN